MSGGLARQGLAGGGSVSPQRVRLAHVEWVAERLNKRDWAVVETVNLLRLMRADQLERLFFFHLHGRSASVSRGRMLRRLVTWRVLELLPRRVGGLAGGSAGSVYALGSAGQRLLAQRQGLAGQAVRVRHAAGTTERTLRHTLMVSELYTSLVEQVRSTDAKLVAFAAEPACWCPDGLGGYVKPDAYLVLDGAKVRDHWWVEADQATESLPTIRRKLLTYLSFLERGQLGPGEVVPRVLVVTVTPGRAAAIRKVIEHLPEPAGQLFEVTTEPQTVQYLFSVLRE